MRRTKILATLGPASHTEEVIGALVDAGLNAVRLNFSHGSRKEHEGLVEAVRAVARAKKVPIPIVQDIQGPKIRVGKLPGGSIPLTTDSEIVLVPGETAPEGRIPVTYDYLADDVRPGDAILMDDGYIGLEVTAVERRAVTCRVTNGGLLKSNKGVNFPGVRLSIKFPTEKDRRDLRTGADLGVEYVAASFVRSAADVARVRADLEEEVPVISKIELREAVENVDEIVRASDGVLVARGDLGVELPPEEVPLVQKRVLALANAAGVMSITATQMLESMIHNPRPTRAEATDVANAILDGSGAVMLSGETATGRYPLDAVQMMGRIAERTEAHYLSGGHDTRRHPVATGEVPDAVAHAAVTTSEDIGAAAIIVLTQSGTTGRLVSMYRPSVPIYGLSPDKQTLRRLNLVWGITPVSLPKAETLDEVRAYTQQALQATGVDEDAHVVLVSGRTGLTGTTNRLRVTTVGQMDQPD